VVQHDIFRPVGIYRISADLTKQVETLGEFRHAACLETLPRINLAWTNLLISAENASGLLSPCTHVLGVPVFGEFQMAPVMRKCIINSRILKPLGKMNHMMIQPYKLKFNSTRTGLQRRLSGKSLQAQF